ncbi:major facilitator superfamily domain-containing protein [Chytridium lagenaria]|nr:major facilitator superfamily domain-containing protein [Chytridium lagenaria]
MPEQDEEDQPRDQPDVGMDERDTRKKWISFVATLFSMTCAGTLYLFSAYAQDLSKRLGFTQTQTNIVASCGGFGLYLSGPVFGYLVDRNSPRVIVGFSGLSIFLGYISMALAYDGYIFGHYLLISLSYALVGVGSSGILNGCLATNMRSFNSRDHGFAVGMSVAFFGLSAFIFSQLSALFMLPIESLLLDTKKALDTFSFLCFIAFTTGGIAFASSFFLMESPASSTNQQAGRDQETSPLQANADGAPPVPARHESIQLFYILDAWLLFVAFLLVTGPGLMFINNIGAIVASLSPEGDVSSIQRLQVGLLSVFNCAGRIVTGIGSDYLSKRYNTSRLLGLFGGSALIAIVQFAAVSITSINMLPWITALLGFGYGAIFSSGPALVGAWFGIKHFGSNWGYAFFSLLAVVVMIYT